MSSLQPKILVIKHGALGDIVQGLDAFANLRQLHADAKICLLTTKAFTSFFENCPWFDEIYTDPRASAWRLDAHMKMRGLFRRGWDSVIDLQCSQRSRRYHQLFFKSMPGRWFGDAPNCSHPIPDFSGVNNRDRMLHTASMTGANKIDAISAASMDWLLAQSQFNLPAENYCVLIPGCSAAKPSKRWMSKGFVELAKLAIADGIQPVLVGTSVDKEAIDEVQLSVPEAINLIGQTGFADLVKLSAASRFVVGNDTGPVFLAARSAAPTIMVMGNDTDPSMSAPVGPKATYLRAKSISDIDAKSVFDAFKTLER